MFFILSDRSQFKKNAIALNFDISLLFLRLYISIAELHRTNLEIALTFFAKVVYFKIMQVNFFKIEYLLRFKMSPLILG